MNGDRFYRISSPKITVLVGTDGRNVIVDAAPIVKKFVGQPLSNLVHWMKKQGRTSTTRMT